MSNRERAERMAYLYASKLVAENGWFCENNEGVSSATKQLVYFFTEAIYAAMEEKDKPEKPKFSPENCFCKNPQNWGNGRKDYV